MNGSRPANSLSGPKGEAGAQGLSGLNGTDGEPGIQGPPGLPVSGKMRNGSPQIFWSSRYNIRETLRDTHPVFYKGSANLISLSPSDFCIMSQAYFTLQRLLNQVEKMRERHFSCRKMKIPNTLRYCPLHFPTFQDLT